MSEEPNNVDHPADYGNWTWDGVGRDEAESGPIRDLAAFHRRRAGDDSALCGPGGHALVPATMLGTIGHVQTGSRRVARESAAETVRVLPVLDDVAVIRLDAAAGAGAPTDLRSIAELGRLRHAWSRKLHEAVVAHLSGRSNSSGRLLDQQLVKGTLADATIGHWEAECVLNAAGADLGDVEWLHVKITEIDRVLLRLLGAHGFTVASPGRTAHLSELLADTYVGKADHDGT
ncbi:MULTISPECIES: hypothetical protein [unclassified Streptomyces]|uniref:hypothetical protein n=1 Tax=unclassified Streptomyces TaxID=2593676 RepID=UPI0036ED913F